MKLPERYWVIIKRFLVLISVSGFLAINQCVDPFAPDINEQADLLVIDGSVVKGREVQIVNISRSSTLYTPKYNPVSGCIVKVMDDKGNEFDFEEKSRGRYSAIIDDDLLQVNNQYKLVVITPEGGHYESEYETLIESAPVDSIYGIMDYRYSTSSGQLYDVIQFYLDLKASEEQSRYYRWELTETWEHRSVYLISYIFDYNIDSIIEIDPPSYEYFYCWTTKHIDGMYSANTLNLEHNEKKKIPLHSLNGSTFRLSVKYSLLVQQYALSEGAYNYWNEKKVVFEESGGLYKTQPSQLISNISNITEEDEEILGYFWTSSSSEKRIFYIKPEEFLVTYPDCRLKDFDRDSILLYPPFLDPVYLELTPEGYKTASPGCFNCTFNGGTNVKPDFWQ